MVRVKAGISRRRRHNKVLRAVKGYTASRRRRFKVAKEAMIKARAYAFKHRRVRKRDFRRLWIARVNAACRLNGLTYSNFMSLLRKADIGVNRKMLSEIAIRHPEAFKAIVDSVKA